MSTPRPRRRILVVLLLAALAVVVLRNATADRGGVYDPDARA